MTTDYDEITSPLALDTDTAMAFLRWVHSDFLKELADDTEDVTDEERTQLTHIAGGFVEAADLLAADPDSPIATLLLGFAFDEWWDDYREHLDGVVEAEVVDEDQAALMPKPRTPIRRQALPMSSVERGQHYQTQNGHTRFTAKQWRRIIHKRNAADRRQQALRDALRA